MNIIISRPLRWYSIRFIERQQCHATYYTQSNPAHRMVCQLPLSLVHFTGSRRTPLEIILGDAQGHRSNSSINLLIVRIASTIFYVKHMGSMRGKVFSWSRVTTAFNDCIHEKKLQIFSEHIGRCWGFVCIYCNALFISVNSIATWWLMTLTSKRGFGMKSHYIQLFWWNINVYSQIISVIHVTGRNPLLKQIYKDGHALGPN